MALSFDSVKKAYKVMKELKLKEIQSSPSEWNYVEDYEKENPLEDKTYGADKKSDNGWENIFFFKKNPSKVFIEKWNILKNNVPNSSFMQVHEENPQFTCFGWF